MGKLLAKEQGMRDTHECMIEIVNATNENDLYFSTIKLKLNDEVLTLKFGITQRDYSLIKKVLEFRPFENTGVAPYRYFFTGLAGKVSDNPELGNITVRVEQLRDHKQFEFNIGKKYAANLNWFQETKDISKFEKLIVK